MSTVIIRGPSTTDMWAQILCVNKVFIKGLSVKLSINKVGEKNCLCFVFYVQRAGLFGQM